MLKIPLLLFFKSKNTYSANIAKMFIRITPGKRKVPDPAGPDGTEKEESILTAAVWPGPWCLEKTDPALVIQKVFPLDEDGRAAAQDFVNGCYDAEPERWQSCPSILDCEPWSAPEVNAEEDK